MDSKKRSTKYKENEAIQFEFDIETDNPDEVAQEMVNLINKKLFQLCSFLYNKDDEISSQIFPFHFNV